MLHLIYFFFLFFLLFNGINRVFSVQTIRGVGLGWGHLCYQLGIIMILYETGSASFLKYFGSTDLVPPEDMVITPTIFNIILQCLFNLHNNTNWLYVKHPTSRKKISHKFSKEETGWRKFF